MLLHYFLKYECQKTGDDLKNVVMNHQLYSVDSTLRPHRYVADVTAAVMSVLHPQKTLLAR